MYTLKIFLTYMSSLFYLFDCYIRFFFIYVFIHTVRLNYWLSASYMPCRIVFLVFWCPFNWFLLLIFRLFSLVCIAWFSGLFGDFSCLFLVCLYMRYLIPCSVRTTGPSASVSSCHREIANPPVLPWQRGQGRRREIFRLVPIYLPQLI